MTGGNLWHYFFPAVDLEEVFCKEWCTRGGDATRLPIRRMLLAFRDRIGQNWIESFKKAGSPSHRCIMQRVGMKILVERLVTLVMQELDAVHAYGYF